MSDVINIAICDDEKIQVELLEKHVKSLRSSLWLTYKKMSKHAIKK